MKVLRLAVGVLMFLGICTLIGCKKKGDSKEVPSAKETPAPSKPAPTGGQKASATTPTKTTPGAQGAAGGQQGMAQGGGGGQAGMGGGMMQGGGGGQAGMGGGGMMQGAGQGGMGGGGMAQGAGQGGMGGEGMMQGAGQGGMGGEGMMQGPGQGGMGGEGMMQGPGQGGMGGEGMMQGPGQGGMGMQGRGGAARKGPKIDARKASNPDTANAEFMRLLSQGRLEAESGEWQKSSETLTKAVAYAAARDKAAKTPVGQANQAVTYPSSTEAKELQKYVARKAAVITHLASARKFADEGKTGQAISEFEKVIEADPTLTNERKILADLCIKAGRSEEAINHYEQILASPQAGNLNDIRPKLASLYLDAGQYSDAARELKVALANSPNDLASVRGLAYAYAELGDYSQAAKALERAIQLDPNSLLLHYHAGFVYRYGLHDFAKAKEHYEHCQSGDIEKKYRNEARKFVNSLVDPTHDRVYLKNGIVNAGEITEETEAGVKVKTRVIVGGRLLEAVKSIPSGKIERIEKAADTEKAFKEKAAEVKEGDAQGQSDLAKWAEKRGLYAQAVQLFDGVLKAAPDHEATRTILDFTKVDGRWVKKAASLSSEYVARSKKAEGADDLRGLSKWCVKHMELFDNLGKAEKLLARADAVEKAAEEEEVAKKKQRQQGGQRMQGEGMTQGPGGGMQGEGTMQGPGGGVQGEGMMQGPGGGVQGEGMMQGPGGGMQGEGTRGQQKGKKSKKKKSRGGRRRR